MNPGKLITFVATRKPSEAREFYERTLGLKLISDDLFAIVFDADGSMLRVQKVQELSPARHTAVGWAVESIDAAGSRLSKTGVKFERFPGLEQDGLGIWQSPSGARVAWFRDPDENILSLTQFA
ncbi:MAG TPA: VOC family protein [Candidatus Dormibacteraeota bacterium]|nr:VOC family protein [Candidatus Dormibacteraeota bacterium]